MFPEIKKVIFLITCNNNRCYYTITSISSHIIFYNSRKILLSAKSQIYVTIDISIDWNIKFLKWGSFATKEKKLLIKLSTGCFICWFFVTEKKGKFQCSPALNLCLLCLHKTSLLKTGFWKVHHKHDLDWALVF